jgi:hypothetical protein
MTPEQVYDLKLAAKIIANWLRARQPSFLEAAIRADSSRLREFASQDGEMAELLELALQEDA